MRTGAPSSAEPSPPPRWRLPLYLSRYSQSRIEDLHGEGRLHEELESESKRTCDDPNIPKWLAPIVDFMFRRNPVEALGIAGVVAGIGCFITSLLKPLWKWLGIILPPLGIVGGIVGYFMGAKLTPGEGASGEPIRVPPGRSDEKQEVS